MTREAAEAALRPGQAPSGAVTMQAPERTHAAIGDPPVDFRLDWGCRLMEKQAEFQRAQRILEIGGGDFARAIALAMRYPKKEFISIDFRYEPAAQENVTKAASLQNISFIRIDALDRFFADEIFDFVFSIAVMEHVAELERFLDSVFVLLKPRGIYSFFEAPFWTSKTGHHFNHNSPAVRKILDSYEHIRFDADGMRKYLESVDDLPFDLEECVRKIYTRPDLSRLSPGETWRIVQASRFATVGWEARLDRDFDEVKAQAALLVHADRYTLDDFRVDAVFARLLRP